MGEVRTIGEQGETVTEIGIDEALGAASDRDVEITAEREVFEDAGPPSTLPIGPVPVRYLVGIAEAEVRDTGEDVRLVVVTETTPMGTSSGFISPEEAIELGERLVSAGQEARGSGLQVVKKPDLIVPGQ